MLATWAVKVLVAATPISSPARVKRTESASRVAWLPITLVTAITVAPRLARQPHRRQGVGGLARLGDPDHQVAGADDRVAVAVLGGDIHLDRDPCPLLDRVAADEARVIAGAAGNDHDPAHLGDELRRRARARTDRRRSSPGRRSVIVSATASACSWISFSVNVSYPAFSAVSSSQVTSITSRVTACPSASMIRAPSGSTVTISPFLSPRARAGLGQERGDRGGDEGLALAEADDQRALLTRCDEAVGVLGVHGDEGVMAAELAEGGADRVGQVAAVVLLDQVGDDLGVGLGAESVALGHELAPQLRVVLDDPVEHDVDLVDAVAVRVRVLLGDPPVGRPARVAEADRRRRRGDRDRAGANRPLGVQAELGPQVGEVADRAHRFDPPLLEQRDAGRVVAAVLELLEPADQQIPAGTRTDVSDDSAHRRRTG